MLMTHTNHRQGTVTDLQDDWVVVMMAATGINDEGSLPKLQQFIRLGLRHNPVNGGTSKVGTAVNIGWDRLIEGVGNTPGVRPIAITFDNITDVAGFLEDLAGADLGLSVVVSGLIPEVDRICRNIGKERHSVQYSLGIWGKTEMFPHPRILEIATMCGHGFVPFKLIHRKAEEVHSGRLSLDQAALDLARPCICGIVNTTRTRRLLQEYIEEMMKHCPA